MYRTRKELDSAIDHLGRRLPALLARTREEDWLEAFAAEADPLRDSAALDDVAHVDGRLQCLLRDAGLIPGDEEPSN
jgi:hypothetical protein